MTTRTPAAFIGHGNPMNALDNNHYTDAWRQFGASVTDARAILMVSAHWFVNATAITAMAQPRTIHDFFGFPPELFAMQYPAPGSPEIAAEVVETVKPTWVGLDDDSWGFDHGTWAVLVHAFPEARIPVLQLSIDASKPIEYHFELGARLAPLREQGIVVMASGNVVHHLGMVNWGLTGQGFDWAHRFDDAARDMILEDPAAVLRLPEHPDFPLAVPTMDHFLPFVYMAGLASVNDTPAQVLTAGYEYGSLSMTSYGLDVYPNAIPIADDHVVPLPDDVPADQTNI